MPANTPLTLLGGLTAAQFLADYWQKRPLLIRGALPDFITPLSPDELAGLACEEGIEARLVEEHGRDTQDRDAPWRVTHGPFDEATFARLPERDWSLLVQAVDHYVPAVNALLDAFHFLPRWRLDDVMVSYAPPGGSVGPHVDQYDVFLLQGSGSRHWQLGGPVAEDAPSISGIDLRILERFEVQPGEDWLLEPGDMLYLPPGIAHHGVSRSEDCMTFSVGFRALSADESITSFADYLGEQLPESRRYADPDLAAPSHPGEIDAAALARIRALILDTFDDPAQLTQWFGRAMTQPKYPDHPVASEHPTEVDTLVAGLQAGAVLERTPGSRFAYRGHDETRATLFVDGDGLDCPLDLARWIAGDEPLDARLLERPDAARLLLQLLDRGSLSWPQDADDDDYSEDEP